MLTDRIHALEERHDALKSMIERECAQPHWNEFKVARLKHKKLTLKDEISRLERMVREQRERQSSS